MLTAPPMWPLKPMILLPHTGGPRTNPPTPPDDECGVCNRFQGAIGAAVELKDFVTAAKYSDALKDHQREAHKVAPR